MTRFIGAMTLCALVMSSASSIDARPASCVLIQDDAVEVEDNREDVAERVKTLKAHIKRKGEEDVEAIGVIDSLTSDFDDLGPADRVAVVKAVDGCLKIKRPKDLEPDVPDDRLFIAASAALGEMGPESVKTLLSYLGAKRHRGNLRLQARIANSIGRTGDERGVRPLVKLLDHNAAQMQAAGASALSAYPELGGKLRKEVFGELLSILVDQKKKVDKDSRDGRVFERWNTISGPFIAAMQQMSGEDIRDLKVWSKWWKTNKKRSWDKDVK